MASIGPVTLSITDPPPAAAGQVSVEVSYRLFATPHDGPHEQAYREVVELIGVDTLAGEDQVDDIIALDPPFWDGIVRVVRGGWSGDVVELGPAPWLILDPSLLSTLLVQLDI